MAKVSIIIPVYNVEAYLAQCLDSVYRQDIPEDEYEVICVDDNPENPTRDIVKRLQQKYSTLKLLVLEHNVKQGGARNAGLSIAQGEYIWFVDADDYVYPNVLGTFYKEMSRGQLDILHFDYSILSDGELRKSIRGEYTNQVVSGVDLFFNPRAQWWTEHIVVWQRIHRRQFLIDNHLKFAEHVFCEDDDFSYLVYAAAKRAKHISVEGYVYRMHSSSAMHQQFKPIYVISLLKQVKRLSSQIDNLRRIDIRFASAIRAVLRSAIQRVLIHIKRMSREEKKIIRKSWSIYDKLGLHRVISKRNILRLFFYLYFPYKGEL